MTKFTIALREIATYKEVLRSQVHRDLGASPSATRLHGLYILSPWSFPTMIPGLKFLASRQVVTLGVAGDCDNVHC